MIRLRLKELLEEKHVSKGKLSRLSDVSLMTINRMTASPTTYSPTLETLQKIARALNVQVSDLYEDIPDN